ncbi:MAG: hypothetical protein PUB09_05005 [Firmicutes bacterium]|nr:hypothetical protein [Bacillota bacterium]
MSKKKNKKKDTIKESPFFKGVCVVYILIAVISGYFSIMYYGEGGANWPVNPTLYIGPIGLILFIENMGMGILGLMWKVKPNVIPNVCLGLAIAEVAYNVICMSLDNGLQTGVFVPVLMILAALRQKKYVEEFNYREMYRRAA